MSLTIRVKNKKKTTTHNPFKGGKIPYWKKGSKPSGYAPSLRKPCDYPSHIDYKTGKPIPGKEPTAHDLASLKKEAIYVQAEILRFFKDGHLLTGDFSRWVRATKSNTMAFYAWVLRDLMPKSVQLSVVGGDGKTPEEMPLVVRIEQRKAAAK